MINIVLLMGPTGAGKSVVGGRLVHELGWSWISSGQLLRQSLGEHPEILAGKLVTSGEVEHIIDTTLTAEMKQLAGHGTIMLDGFPRTLGQAEWLATRCGAWGCRLTAAIFLDVPEAVSRQRLAGRARADDTPGGIDSKWQEYQRVTLPVLDYYMQQGLLRRVDAAAAPETVYNRVLESLGR